VIAALELGPRVERAGRALAFCVAQVPMAVAAALLVATLAAGAVLSVVAVGLPLVILAAAGCRGLQRIDRRLTNRVLGTSIPPPAGRLLGTPGAWRHPLALVGDRALWRTAGGLALKPPLLLGLGLLVAVPLGVTALLVWTGAQGVLGLGEAEYVGPLPFGPGTGAALLALAPAAAILSVAVLEAVEHLLGTIMRGLLMPTTAVTGPVRELLAESLGDRSVSVAYWLPDRELFVDEAGRPVTLPEPGSGRAWTAVERDGRRVAAIVHDAALDTSRELVQAAAAASSLAIDNERLKADLRAQLEELERSRRRIVEAADAARRRIERDLHDGAQQHLVALALELRLLRAKMGPDSELASMVDGLSGRLAEALAELRELARGIHPAILTDRGLAPALHAIIDRCPLEIEADIDVPVRLPAPVEAAAYFVVAEGLTNVTKYAAVEHASVRAAVAGGEVTVLVADHGPGGARIDAGTGLRGLQDRVAAVGGRLWLHSPPGGGTQLGASIPCATGVSAGPAAAGGAPHEAVAA
jgi:signal transduction histidine kinase